MTATLAETFALAEAHHRAGRLDQAVELYRAALALEPGHAESLHRLGTIAAETGHGALAAELLRRAVAADGAVAAHHAGLGNALHDLGRFEAAAACHRRALELEPGNLVARVNLGNALRELGRLDEAAAELGLAAERAPGHPAVHLSLGCALHELGRPDEAAACHRRALALAPDNPEAHWNLGLALLLAGDLAAGWPEYAWRRLAEGGPRRSFPRPAWDGGDLAGRTILLHAEQGLGDVLQFIRYLPWIKARGAAVTIVESPTALLRLLRGVAGIDRLIPTGGAALPEHDRHAPLPELPHLFATTEDTIPAAVPYLSPEPELVAMWRERLAAGPPGLKVGIAWQGNPHGRIDRGRSPPLAALAPLAAVPGVRLISLQRRDGLEQLAGLPGGMVIESLGDDVDTGGAFTDTAAIMATLDLVISSDTAIAHLAGALGVPAWVALKRVPDWRWQLGRADSPWYPTLRLFRQSRDGDWDGVFRAIAAALAVRAATAPEAAAPLTPVSWGELIDKLTILDIKAARLEDPAKRANVERELAALAAVRDRAGVASPALSALTRDLRAINAALWDIEDEIRDHERAGDFGPRFVELARAVYHTNDRRADAKRRVNALLNSALVEEKSYKPY